MHYGSNVVTHNPLANDLDHIFLHTEEYWEELRNQHIFMTGGTGFFGCWLLESFLRANEQLRLNASVSVLSRNVDNFKKKAPHIAGHPAVQLYFGDVRNFTFPAGTYSYVIHVYNEAADYINVKNFSLVTDAIIQAAKHTLEFSRYCEARKFLFTSSGSVYGIQPVGMKNIPEEYQGCHGGNDFRSAHGKGKHGAEKLCMEYYAEYGLETKIARCFTFIGPYLPLNSNYAAGNFIGDGLNGGPIFVKGDGTQYRSYLYAADLAVWLWTILFKGKTLCPYNVGSMESITIGELAKRISVAFSWPVEVIVAKKPAPGQKYELYIPDTQRAEKELNLCQWISLDEGIERTIKWHKRQGS